MAIVLLAFREGKLSTEYLARIQALVPEMQLVVTQKQEAIEALLDEIEIAVGGFPHALLARAPRLRWFQNWGAGVDWLLRYPQLAEKGLVVTNTSGLHAIPISEHILAFLLSFACGFPQQFRNQQQRIWASPKSPRPIELAGKTLLLIGVGAIGKRTAQVAAALEMRVIGVRRNPEWDEAHVEAMMGLEQLHEALPQADFVVLTVPLTPETQGLIGEQELRLMKPTAYLINIGRGGTVQQDALIHALQAGWVAGAGLDVVTPEPLPADSPLWAMENVIITAHYSGGTAAYTERAMEIFLDNLERYVARKPLRNIVDKRLGY